MSDRLSVSVMALVALLLCGAAAAQSVGTVTGSVERNRTPLAGVRIALESRADSSFGATARTDERGAFTFADAPVGEFVVKVYDGDDELLASSAGVIDRAGQVVTVLLTVDR